MDPSHNSVIERMSSSPQESKPETKKKIVLDDEDADAADDDKTLKKKKTTKTKKKKPGSLPLIMFLSLDEETPRDCINSSNPFHKCADHCFRRTKSAEDGGKANKKVADHTNNSSSCANASNPFHVCADTCFVSHKKNSTLPPYNYNKDRHRQADPERVVVEKPKEKTTHHHHRMVHPLCPNASNPFHICVQLCLQKIADKDKPKEEEEDHVQRIIIPNKDQAQKHVVVTAKEKKDSVQVTERMVHPLCSYASNPFHICVEACFQTIPVKQSNTHVPASKGGKENIVEMAKNNNIGGLTKCKNASNPFHTCADHCSSFQA